MHRGTLTHTATRLAVRLAGAVALTGVLVAGQSAATSVALAASHHAPHHTARRAHAAGSGALDLRWSAPHGFAAPSTLGSTASASPKPPAPGSSASTSATCANADLVPTSENLQLIAAATLCLVNHQRAIRGEHPLRDNAKLDSSATHHSQDMIAANYYEHTSPTGETALDRIMASGYVSRGSGYEIGENIDLGGGIFATPAAIVGAWMNSPGHRDNILNSDFVDTGIGVAAQVPAEVASGQVGATYTQDFGAVQSPAGVIF